MDDAAITSGLQRGVIHAVENLTRVVQPPVTVVSLEIYPWHSYVALSVLDAACPPGVEDHPADWPLFECASSVDTGVGAEVIEAWGPVADAMHRAWSRAVETGAGDAASEHLHRLAANALTSGVVSAALRTAGWDGCRRQVIDADDPNRRNYASDTIDS